MLNIRHTTEEDIPRCMELYGIAKSIMRASGNMLQWEDGYPSEKILRQDISMGNSYAVVENNIVVGTFACIVGDDPTYAYIEGEWKDTTLSYATIHRLASTPKSHGVAKCAFDYACDIAPSVRADTHRDNLIMQHVMEKYGFQFCGIIYLANGDSRKAYQFIP